jgi:putative ABC transport system permease protein
MLISESILPALIATIAVSPVFIWLGMKWLEDFAFKTTIDASIIVATAIISISIAVFTVISVTWRAATSNPADSLRYE